MAGRTLFLNHTFGALALLRKTTHVNAPPILQRTAFSTRLITFPIYSSHLSPPQRLSPSPAPHRKPETAHKIVRTAASSNQQSAPMTAVDERAPRQLLPNLWVLENDPQEDPFAAKNGLQVNSYVVVVDGPKTLFVDVASASLLPAVRQLCKEQGLEPVASLLTHRHVIGKGAGVQSFVEAFPGVPIFLHPSDADAEQGRNSGVSFKDPTASKLLADLGIRTWVFPGHTAGSAHYYSAKEGGVLFIGDTAVGAPAGRAQPGEDHMTRPPMFLNEDDGTLQQNWKQFLTGEGAAQVATLAPLHGKVYVGESAGRVRDVTKSLYEMEAGGSF